MTTFHAEYDLPGSFFGETVSRELPERSVAAAKAAAPKSAFAFTLYECPDPVGLGPEYRAAEAKPYIDHGDDPRDPRGLPAFDPEVLEEVRRFYENKGREIQ